VSITRTDPYVPQRGSATERLRADLRFFVRGVKALACRSRNRHVVSFCPSIFTVLLGGIVAGRNHRHIAVVHDIQSGLAEGLGFRGARQFARLLRGIEASALNRADAVVVLSLEMANQLRSLGVTAPILELPIWVDTNAIYPIDQTDPAHPPTLLYSGNLGKKQGLGLLLDLAERVATARPDVRVLVRGAGNQSSALLDAVKARKLDNVAFQSLVPKDELNRALADGDVHLVPQDPNAADFALPSKLYTIMAAGRAAIATGRPGSALWRLARASDGFICVPPENLDLLVARSIELLDDKNKRVHLGMSGRRFVLEFAARDKVLLAYQQLIASPRS
jgi:colanic acid biosynthesis glycosyl transferase WcaI